MLNDLLTAVPPGSYLTVLHPASDLDPALRIAGYRWNQAAAGQQVTLHTREEVAGFLAGLDLLESGLATAPEWHPEPDDPGWKGVVPLYAAIARKA